MTIAGPAAVMATPLPTKSPAPMMPPMVIIATWRGRRDWLSALSSARAAATASFICHRLQRQIVEPGWPYTDHSWSMHPNQAPELPGHSPCAAGIAAYAMRFQRLPGVLSRRRQITRERPADDYLAEFVRHVNPRKT